MARVAARLHGLCRRPWDHWGRWDPVFNLTAQAAYLNMPDGQAVYSWGYGCDGTANAGLRSRGHSRRHLQLDAGSRPHPDRPRE